MIGTWDCKAGYNVFKTCSISKSVRWVILILFHNPSAIPLLAVDFLPLLDDVVLVANNRKLSLAMIFSPLVGINKVRDSRRGMSTDTTSAGAKSISSTRIHRPSETAVVNTPGCHLKDPGVDVDT